MQRVLIIGSGGAGKSTLARRLGSVTGLPVIHLDEHYWQPGWVEPDKAEWSCRVDELLEQETWIMDGNFSGTLDQRLRAADTVILLDLSRWRCLWRVIKRWLNHRGREREEMPAGCPERLSWGFLHWVLLYPNISRPRITGVLDRHAESVDVIRLDRPSAIAAFLRRQGDSVTIDG
ncbi:MAG: AAA family ATPase [Pseudomonadota bacterium]